MTYKTHKQFSISFAILTSMAFYVKNIMDLNYYIIVIIMLMTSKVGALFPDIDHHWGSVKEKNLIVFILNKIIIKTGGKHRSKHTHSLDVFILYTVSIIVLLNKLNDTLILSEIEYVIFKILHISFCVGWASHLFSDMLTSGKIWLSCFLNIKIGLVPRKMKKTNMILLAVLISTLGIASAIYLSTIIITSILLLFALLLLITAFVLGDCIFNTGDKWENYVYKMCRLSNTILEAIAIAFPLILKINIQEVTIWVTNLF